MAVAVLDVDGVVADVRHRLHHLESVPKDWEAFFGAAAVDPPLAEGVALARELAGSVDVVWLTGRPERLRAVTGAWLLAQGLPGGELLMRRAGDYRPARLMKRDRLRALRRDREVMLVVDDDPEVVAMVEAEGLAVLLADWVPRSAALGRAQEREGRT